MPLKPRFVQGDFVFGQISRVPRLVDSMIPTGLRPRDRWLARLAPVRRREPAARRLRVDYSFIVDASAVPERGLIGGAWVGLTGNKQTVDDADRTAETIEFEILCAH
jgi:hypothetical protein